MKAGNKLGVRAYNLNDPFHRNVELQNSKCELHYT